MEPVQEGAPVEVQRSTRYPPVQFALISLAIIFFLYQIVGGGIVDLVFGPFPKASQVLLFRVANMAAEILFVLVPTIYLGKVQTKDLKSFFKLKVANWRQIFFAGIGIIALQEVLEIYTYFQSLVPLPSNVRQFMENYQQAVDQLYRLLMTTNTTGDFVLVTLVVAVTPAVCEEFLFRGLVQSNFHIATKRWTAILLTGIIFGAYHVQPVTLVGLCALGIYLSYILNVSQSIMVPIAAHFANNFYTVLVFHLSGKDSLLIPENDRVVSASSVAIWLVVSLIVFVGCLQLMKPKTEKSKGAEPA